MPEKNSLKGDKTRKKMLLKTDHKLSVIFGILGNIVSFVVFLAPIPTFYRVFKKRSSEGYQSIPYVVALFSAIFLLYYGSLKADGTLIITINGFGCAIEVVYLIIYLVFATSKAKMFTIKLIVFLNLGTCGLAVLLTGLLIKGSQRVKVVGWICAVINICVFASPLTVMGKVIKTKSVEFMPFPLSFFLTLTAAVWFFYGFYTNDYFIAVPNVLGLLLGVAQMVLYGIYRGSKEKNTPDLKPNMADNASCKTEKIEVKVLEKSLTVKEELGNA